MRAFDCFSEDRIIVFPFAVICTIDLNVLRGSSAFLVTFDIGHRKIPVLGL